MKLLDQILAGILAAILIVYGFGLLNSGNSIGVLIFIAILATVPVFVGAIRALIEKKVSVDLLAAIALTASLLLKEWTSAVFINLMLVSARILESYSENRARSAIVGLMKLRPGKIRVKRGHEIVEEDPDHISSGELIIVEAGERVPVDGIIENGEASIDQSSLTGESVPVFKKKGDKILSSTLNISGSLVVQARQVGKDTTFERIIDLVEGAHRAKAKINNIADRFAGIYVILTLAGAIAVYIFSKNPILVLSILLVACADDIAVAIPLAFIISIGRAAKRGIIIKGGDFLELMTKIKTIVVDKTGTLTFGRLMVEKVIPFGHYDSKKVLELAATADLFSEHFSARSIVDYAKSKGIHFTEPKVFNEIPGMGSSAIFNGKTILSGKVPFLLESKVVISQEQKSVIDKIESDGFNITLIAYGKELIGLIVLADKIRPEVIETIPQLKTAGVGQIIMLTGDNDKVAQKVADQTGISEFHADLLPEDKLNFIKGRLREGSKLAMVGDGVNDAAALAMADVGIAMGAIGSDAAIEAADIALMNDKFSRIPEIIKIGRRTVHISYQNFWIWGLVNLVGLVLIFGGLIGPQGAAAYNFVTDFLPLINAARLFR